MACAPTRPRRPRPTSPWKSPPAARMLELGSDSGFPSSAGAAVSQFLHARFWIAFLVLLLISTGLRADALDRLKLERLAAVHAAIEALRSEHQAVPRTGPYQDYRANLHVHSLLSHDSRGTLAEIVAAAKVVGTRVLMFTEHPSEKHDYFTDGHRGLRDGVLLIPGAETNGFLAYPTRSLRGASLGSPQEFTDLVRGRGGLMFVSHLEERMDWELRNLTGVEIYNTHADVKDETRLMTSLRNPLWIVGSVELFRKYPQEAFSALQDYPADYLRRWDQLCQRAPHTGVAANDAHQNTGVTIRRTEDGKARVEDALGKKILEMDARLLPKLPAAAREKEGSDLLFELRMDPYVNSLRHVGTHLLLTELSQKAVWAALEAGRAYVAFDWLADATGFDFAALAGTQRHEMGSRVKLEKGLRLQAQAPLPVHWKLLCNGQIVSEQDGRKLDVPVKDAGNYRVEAWLKIAGEDMIWILSNPIYLTAAAAESNQAENPRIREWTVDGERRQALVIAPRRKSAAGSPVILAFHGHGGTMQTMARKGFQKHWPEALVVCPQGLPTATVRDPDGKRSGWQPRLGENKDRDLKFVDAILKSLRETDKIDDQRIYATGHSNGGGFTYLLWAARRSEFAALAPSAAGGGNSRSGRALQPLPILHVAGEKDDIVPFEAQKRTMDAARKVNGCDPEGKPWATAGKLVGTIYPSKGGTPFVAVIHPGTHQYPDEAPELIVKFFKEQVRK